MFGYVKSDTPNMYVKDTVLYKAMYCGLCKGIGKSCGQKARFLLNYDLAFLSTLLHNVLGKDVTIKKEHCVIHRIGKRPIANVDELTERIACLNVILAYYKLKDAVDDKEKGKTGKLFFTSSYRRAKKREPEMEQSVNQMYKKLNALQKENTDSIDLSADPFGNMMAEVVKILVGEKITEELSEIAYNIGKWVYLIDAVDDYDKDIKKKSFNVFYNAYGYKSKQQLMEKAGSEVVLIFSAVLNRIGELSTKINYKFNHDLCDNVLQRGLIKETKRVMENKKCKNTTEF